MQVNIQGYQFYLFNIDYADS